MLLNKHNLQIAELASKEESSYTLNAIHVTNKWTATTNGHYIVTVTLPNVSDSSFPKVEGFTPSNDATPSFLLYRDVALDIAKSIPKKTTIPILQHASVGVTDEQVSLCVTDLDSPKVFRPRKVDGNFPKIEAVIPKDEAATLTIGFKAEYLMQLCKSAIASCKTNSDVVITVFLKDANSAIKMTAHNDETGQDWMAVLMPWLISESPRPTCVFCSKQYCKCSVMENAK